MRRQRKEFGHLLALDHCHLLEPKQMTVKALPHDTVLG